MLLLLFLLMLRSMEWGGSNIRPEATGYGAVYFGLEILQDKGEDIKVGIVCIAIVFFVVVLIVYVGRREARVQCKSVEGQHASITCLSSLTLLSGIVSVSWPSRACTPTCMLN